MILTCLWLPPNISFVLMLGMLLLVVLIPTVMSYLWYQKLSADQCGNKEEDK